VSFSGLLRRFAPRKKPRSILRDAPLRGAPQRM
jgi:hypothetical protein